MSTDRDEFTLEEATAKAEEAAFMYEHPRVPSVSRTLLREIRRLEGVLADRAVEISSCATCGHPVESGGLLTDAAIEGLAFQLLFRPARDEPTEPGWYLLYNQCDGFHLAEAWREEDGEFIGFRGWCAAGYFFKDGFCAWAQLPDTGDALYDTFARTVPNSSPPGDCPHAAPFRYCAVCAADPCPIGLGNKGIRNE